jgi:hypothetical protein
MDFEYNIILNSYDYKDIDLDSKDEDGGPSSHPPSAFQPPPHVIAAANHRS